VSSGNIVKQYERHCANSIGRILKQQLKKNPALIGKAGHSCASIGKAWFTAQKKKFADFLCSSGFACKRNKNRSTKSIGAA
jgi:hypothetical protein